MRYRKILTRTTIRGTEVRRVLSGRCNAYLVGRNEKFALIDTGTSDHVESLVRNLEAQKIRPGTISHLILTHTHYDHCQNAAWIQSEWECQIIASDAEAVYTASGFTPLPAGTVFFTRMLSLIGNYFAKRRFGYPPFHVDKKVKQEKTLELGSSVLRLLPTPGHSPGSISIIVDDDIALVGDSLFGVFPGSVFPPYADDVSILLSSWELLLQTKCRYFMPGHGATVHRSLFEKEYLKMRLKHPQRSG